MNLARLWLFADKTHPVYERPATDIRWPVPLPQYRPRPYIDIEVELPQVPEAKVEAPREIFTLEELRMETIGAPSFELYQRRGTGFTVQRLRLRTRYMRWIDLSELRELAREYYEALRALSRGPYTLKMLREMGHPYGYQGNIPRNWAALRRPRRLPLMRSVRLRGRFVPNRSVINYQSGRLYASWRYAVLPHAKGVSVVFWNEALSQRGAPYPWFLAHGTIKMQAHGPWGYLAELYVSRFHRVWREAAYQAWRRARAEEGQFGETATISPDIQGLEPLMWQSGEETE